MRGSGVKKKRVPQLGENHRRGIATTLTLLDEALCEFEQWAGGRELRSVLYEERNALSPEQRAKILAEVAQMRERLRKLRDALGLEGSVRDAATAIWGQCSGLWEHLVELEAKHLRRYGELPPGLARYLDPQVAALLLHLRQISRSCSSPSQGELG